MGQRVGVIVVALALAWSRAAHADLIVTISNQVIPIDQAGTVDVYVSGDGDAIAGFDLSFSIEGIDNQSDLIFVEAQDLTYASDPDYVLFGLDPDPLDFDYPPARVDLDIFDEVGLGSPDPDVVVSDQKLLARLSLQNVLLGDPALALADVFTITAVATFYDASGGDVPVEKVNNGTVLTVPEPSTVGLTIVGAMLLACAVWRRQRGGSDDVPITG